MEASVELEESPNGNLESGIGIEGGGVESGEGAEDPEGAASSSLSSTPDAVAPPPIRFDGSIVDAATGQDWPRVIALHEEGISLDSRGVRVIHHCIIMTCNLHFTL